MKFNITITLALLSAAVSAIAVPSDASTELTARDILDLDEIAPEAATDFDLDDTSDIPDSAVADVDEDDEFTPDELAFLASFNDDSDEGPNTENALAARSPDALNARGVRAPDPSLIKLLLRKLSNTALGKKVWTKIPKSKRKKITKYVKKAAKSKKKTSKKTKKWIAKEVKPAATKVLAAVIGAGAAKVIINDVLPRIVNTILDIIF